MQYVGHLRAPLSLSRLQWALVGAQPTLAAVVDLVLPCTCRDSDRFYFSVSFSTHQKQVPLKEKDSPKWVLGCYTHDGPFMHAGTCSPWRGREKSGKSVAGWVDPWVQLVLPKIKRLTNGCGSKFNSQGYALLVPFTKAEFRYIV